jgi:hypothetical protein
MNKPFYQCAVCRQGFETIEDLHAHEQEFHNPQEDADVSTRSAGGPFPCPECGVDLRTAEEVEEHLASEHPVRAGMGEPGIQKSNR